MTRTIHFLALAIFCFVTTVSFAADRPPNIVFMMSDELAYYELSHMGNQKLRTPRIDQMARQGIRFTQALAGSPVCAPLRCNLMTGMHSGHASVRANDGGSPLRADEPTIASMLKDIGFATGGFGKWGAGGRQSTGVPEKHGFDTFFGYYDQVHAHSFYPPYLIRNSEEVVLPGNAGGREGETYSHYEIMNEGLQFIRDNAKQPFFCYLPITPPHGMYDIPDDDPAWKQYAEDAWMNDPEVSSEAKRYAAMVTMVDRNLGEVLDLLRELGLEENTIVFFTGDNGGQDRFRSSEYPRGYFGPNVDPKTGVEFRGGKGNLYEGGLRIPFIARWPGKIPSGQVSDLLFYQPDVLPTLAELTGATAPSNIDGLSILPTLLGMPEQQKQHEFLYWEFGSQVAVRMDHWKAIQPKKDKDWALYDLRTDVSETNDVADQNTELLARMKQAAAQSHEPVRPGTYSDPDQPLHQKDRQAKWGTTRPPEKPGNKRKFNRINDKGRIPVERVRLLSFSSQNKGNDRLAEYAIDGKPNKFWHSRFSPDKAAHPHELVLDLGMPYNITGFRYLPRQDQSWNGAFATTKFFVCQSPQDKGDLVVSKTFEKSRKVQSADCKEPLAGRYIRVVIESEVNGGPWASAADIGVIGSKP